MARPPRVDRRRAEKAVRELLLAFGLDPASAELKETPARVAKAWGELFIAGNHQDPIRALGPNHPSTSRGAVVACGIPFFSMCPHHLLPSSGLVHVAFHPRGKVPGFGRIGAMIDALAHRLVLQEDLTQAIADTLETRLRPWASAVVVEARHFCMVVSDPERAGTVFRTTAVAGDPEKGAALLLEIDRALRLKTQEKAREGGQ